MDRKELEQELRLKYGKHRKNLSDPFELLDLVLDYNKLDDKEKNEAAELAEEIYFGYDIERNEYYKES